MLNEQLQSQIEQEANERAKGLFNSHSKFIARTEYTIGAEKYAELLQAAEARADRYEKALKEIKELVDKAEQESIFVDEFTIRKILAIALTPKTSTDE